MINRHTEKSTPLGVARPTPLHERQQLKIILESKDGASSWSATLELQTKLTAPPQFLLLELPAKVQKPAGKMVQLSDTESEFTVKLAGPASPATLTNLSGTPIKDWMATMFTKFAMSKAAIGILVTHGKVSLTLHEGE